MSRGEASPDEARDRDEVSTRSDVKAGGEAFPGEGSRRELEARQGEARQRHKARQGLEAWQRIESWSRKAVARVETRDRGGAC
jgi:hypothetical protein